MMHCTNLPSCNCYICVCAAKRKDKENVSVRDISAEHKTTGVGYVCVT